MQINVGDVEQLTVSVIEFGASVVKLKIAGEYQGEHWEEERTITGADTLTVRVYATAPPGLEEFNAMKRKIVQEYAATLAPLLGGEDD